MNELTHVSVPVKVKFDENYQSDKFIKLVLTFAHDGINPNKSRFTISDLTGHKDSLFLSPLLGNIVQDEEGNYAFGMHDMEFRPNPFKDGKLQVYYLENIIGLIPPEDKAEFTTVAIDGRNYVQTVGYLYKNYSNFAEDIIAQYDSVPISMEIDVFKYSFNVKDNVYDITDFAYTGITFLNQNCGTGMIGANATFFSEVDFHKQLFTLAQEMKNNLLEEFELCNKNNDKGGNTILDNNETFNGTGEPTPVELAPEVTPIEPEVVFEQPTENPVPAEPVQSDKFVKTFELSHEDIRCGLYTLLSSVEENDNQWYYIECVYDTYFDYTDFDNTKHYRQTYVKDGDSINFDGDRIDIFVERLTSAEKSALDLLRNNYATEHQEYEELKQFKAKYDEDVIKAEKNKVFEEWGSRIGEGNQTFEALKADSANFSAEELTVKCKCIFADIALNAPANTFSATQTPKASDPTEIKFNNNVETSKPLLYGGLFEEFK